MSVTQRGKSWQAAVYYKDLRDRKDFPTKQEALIWEAQTKAAMLAGTWVKGGAKAVEAKKDVITLQMLLDHTEAIRWAGTRGGKTAMINAGDVVRILGPERDVKSITKADAITIKKAMIERCRSDATTNRKLAALSTMLKEAREMQWVETSFTFGLTKERNNRVRFFSADEEKQMLDWCEKHRQELLRDYIIVSLDTGFRQGEILKIVKRDVGSDNLWTYYTKNGLNRAVPLTDRARDVLERRAQPLDDPDSAVFDIKPAALRDRWFKMQTDLKMLDDQNYTPHVLRHTFVTRLLHLGEDIKTVMELAGHNRIETTQRYAQTSEERKVSAIKRLAPQSPHGVQRTPTGLSTVA